MKRILPSAFLLILTLLFIVPRPALSGSDREQEIRTIVTTFVTSRTAGMGWDVTIRRMAIPNVQKLPEGNIEYEIVAPKQWEGWGNVSIAILARQKDKVVRNISVQIDVEALADTVVTLRQLDHGTDITAADLVVQKREITQSSHLAARKVDEVTGKIARTTIRANQPVCSDMIERVPLIKSGQTVTIIGENEVLKISVAGIAHSSGAVGDIIRVKNMTSLKEIPARVIDASTVQVAL